MTIDPKPKFSYYPKTICSFLKNNKIIYDYSNVKKVCFGLIKPSSEIEEFALNACLIIDVFILYRQFEIKTIFNKINTLFNKLIVSDNIIEKYQDQTILTSAELLIDSLKYEDLIKKFCLFYASQHIISQVQNLYYILPVNLFIDCDKLFKNNDTNKLAFYLNSKSHNSQIVTNINLKEIKEKFELLDLKIINSYIKKIWIYGSLIDGTFNSQSDIDIWVIPNNEASKKEKREIAKLLKSFIYNLYEIDTDIIFGDLEDAQILQGVKKEVLWAQKE